VRITSKGQVTIPQDIRERLGLLPDTEVEFEVDRDAVRITRAEGATARTRGRDLIARMRGRATTRMTTDQIMRLMRG
jgi:AbrB family looped-hinge helix DNA binding protein